MLGRWLAVFVLVCSCGTESSLGPQIQELPRTQAITRRPAPSDEIAARANQIARDIAALRGWDATLDVSIEWADNERMTAAVVSDEDSQIAPTARQAQADFLKAFGWIPGDFDFERDVAKRFSLDLSGLYCFTWRRILLRVHGDQAAVDSTLRHELVHAFQDKYFHISAQVRWQSDQGDRIAAMHALAEGEATCIARQLEDPRHRGCFEAFDDDPDNRLLQRDAQAVPAVIRYALLSPYIDGTRFVRRLLRLGGWPAVDRAWSGSLNATRDLVRETAPERERPIDIPESVFKGGECRLEYLDVWGEQGLAGVLFRSLNSTDASRWATNLSADRAAYWRCADRCAAAWRVRLASNIAAASFANVVGIVPQAEWRSPTPSQMCRLTSTGALSLMTVGRDIAITSVHGCNGMVSPRGAISCETANDLADRLIRQ